MGLVTSLETENAMGRHRHTVRKVHVSMKEEMEAMWPQAKECQVLWTTSGSCRRQGRILSSGLEGMRSCWHLQFGLLAMRQAVSAVLSNSVLLCYHSPGNTYNMPPSLSSTPFYLIIPKYWLKISYMPQTSPSALDKHQIGTPPCIGVGWNKYFIDLR